VEWAWRRRGFREEVDIFLEGVVVLVVGGGLVWVDRFIDRLIDCLVD
jgi:hypothetical protein